MTVWQTKTVSLTVDWLATNWLNLPGWFHSRNLTILQLVVKFSRFYRKRFFMEFMKFAEWTKYFGLLKHIIYVFHKANFVGSIVWSVHSHVHKSQQFVPNTSQINPAHVLPSMSSFYILLTVHHVIILGKWPTWWTNYFLCIYFYL